MRSKKHPAEKPRGVRDPSVPSCMAQSGGKLVWIQDGQPMFWSDRPFKFPAHIRLMLRKRGGTVIEDIKWKQLAGKAWWRLPDWPDGNADAERGFREPNVCVTSADAEWVRTAASIVKGGSASRLVRLKAASYLTRIARDAERDISTNQKEQT